MDNIHVSQHVWMTDCDYGFPKQNAAITELEVVYVGKKYFRCHKVTEDSDDSFEFLLKNGFEHNKVCGKSGGSYRKAFVTKDKIYDACDMRSCLQALQTAEMRNFNGITLRQLDAIADILGVKYKKIRRE